MVYCVTPFAHAYSREIWTIVICLNAWHPDSMDAIHFHAASCYTFTRACLCSPQQYNVGKWPCKYYTAIPQFSLPFQEHRDTGYQSSLSCSKKHIHDYLSPFFITCRRRMLACLMTMERTWPVCRLCRGSMRDLRYLYLSQQPGSPATTENNLLRGYKLYPMHCMHTHAQFMVS